MTKKQRKARVQENIARKKNLDERMAAQWAAERKGKIKRFFIIFGIAAVVVAAVVMIAIFAGVPSGVLPCH